MMIFIFPQITQQSIDATGKGFSIGEYQYTEYDLYDQQKEQECSILECLERKTTHTNLLLCIIIWGEMLA